MTPADASLAFLRAVRDGHSNLFRIAEVTGLGIAGAAEVLARGLKAERLRLTGNGNVIEEVRA